MKGEAPPTTEPTITQPPQFTMPNNYVAQPHTNAYMTPLPSSTNPYITHHVYHHHLPSYVNPNQYTNQYTRHSHVPSAIDQSMKGVPIGNTHYSHNIPYIPYIITDAPSIPYTSYHNIPTTISSSYRNKNFPRRQFQTGLNTQQLRHARQDEQLRLRRSDREQRLHQKRKSLSNRNLKLNKNKSQNAVVRINSSKAKTKLNDARKTGNTSNQISKAFVSNAKKQETTLQSLTLNSNNKNIKHRKLQKLYTMQRMLRKGQYQSFRYPTVDESRRKEEFPTLQEIDELKDGEYFVHGKEIIVRCNYKEKDGYSIGFSCPFCFNKYKKNGLPYKRAKPSKHYHGCGRENIKNGAFGSCGTRVPHCNHVFRNGSQYQMAPLGYQFHLYVTPSTKVVEQK